MQVFVTGGTGLLGRNLVQALRWEGHKVKVLVRSMEKARQVLNDPAVSYVIGDMREVDRWAHELEGCAAVFHTAASRTGNLLDINVKGTVHLLLQAHRLRARRFVHFGAAETIAVKPSGAPGDESSGTSERALSDAFLSSKLQSEDAVRRFVQHNDISVTTLLAGPMLGPGDLSGSPIGQAVLQVLRGRAVLRARGGTTIADARDVALAAIAALDRKFEGARFIVAGNYVGYPELASALDRAIGNADEKRPLYTRFFGAVRLQPSQFVSSSKAALELNAKFRPLEETLRDTVEWQARSAARGMVA